jgi:3-hydroxyacyl-CoA dehydrogenase / 3-hydroxy-2-methylbutyryl-CoA dehydrogenase
MIQDELKERFFAVKCDVTKEEDVKNAVEKSVERYGAIHVSIPCAGVAWPGMTLTSKGSLNMDTFSKVVQINLFGSTYVAKYSAVAMSKNKPVNDLGEKGVIIFVSSVAAEEGQRGQVAYSATKGALNGMVLPMARDLGKFGIRVAAIAPGIFGTPLSLKMPKSVTDRLNADTPMGRMGQPHEFAHFCGAIIENSYINGVSLRVDGATKFSNL